MFSFGNRGTTLKGHPKEGHYLGFIGAFGYKQAAKSAIEMGPPVAIIVTPERYATWDFTEEPPWFGRVWLQAKRMLPPLAVSGYGGAGLPIYTFQHQPHDHDQAD